jgi:hypothetical protein
MHWKGAGKEIGGVLQTKTKAAGPGANTMLSSS